ncbi:hypothetical protein SDRG_07129 [Saprolegnia diclina VS20]|uniref:Uncharacterized protein n=1 Tax=Saprolegnia diclina (strain VS20) TaxID=1156394 RepID=T0QC10_SAPDV|nr:hypothetical protein SDRG_07129 [Saprolegnia diclina VS20]EQC35419.1 hypothetical protein SDRG_07129 [Saprolegnia diclina VS20]|eukprot:XP_008611169.1 hypothetical protein SDRG_07129 [Saprolegnia diclina VS20]
MGDAGSDTLLERTARPPWLADVDEEAVDYDHLPVRAEDTLVRCSGILRDGARCTRTCVVDRAQLSHPPNSYCYKHHGQAAANSHGYAPLAVSDLQVPPPTRRQCVCSHWTSLAMLFVCSFSLAVFCLVLALALHEPTLGILGVTFFAVPIGLLGYCLLQMMMHAFIPSPRPLDAVELLI